MHYQNLCKKKQKTLGDSFGKRCPFVWIIFFFTLHNISQFLQGFLTRSGSKLPIKKSYIYYRPIFFTDLKNDLKTTEGLNKAITSFSEFKKGHREETKPTWLVYYLHFVLSLLGALLFILASHEMMLCICPLNVSYYYSCFDSSNGFWTSITDSPQPLQMICGAESI